MARASETLEVSVHVAQVESHLCSAQPRRGKRGMHAELHTDLCIIYISTYDTLCIPSSLASKIIGHNLVITFFSFPGLRRVRTTEYPYWTGPIRWSTEKQRSIRIQSRDPISFERALNEHMYVSV